MNAGYTLLVIYKAALFEEYDHLFTLLDNDRHGEVHFLVSHKIHT